VDSFVGGRLSRDLVRVLSLGCVWPVVLSACSRKATLEDCQKACQHVAQLQVGPARTQMLGKLHELDERVEYVEDQAKRNLEQLRKDAAGGDPTWDEKAFAKRKLSPAARKAARERHEAEVAELKRQRQEAIAREEKTVADEKQSFAAVKKAAEADLARTVSDKTAACVTDCRTRTFAQAECLTRTQAIEDLKICIPN
jgi:hypothetical protein